MRNLVAPMFGLGSKYKSQFGKVLPVPNWLYEHLERWHYLSFLKTRKNMELLRKIKFQAVEPQKIDALIDLVDHDLGYRLYQSIERTKCALSDEAQTEFRFDEAAVVIEKAVTRAAVRKLDRSRSFADQPLRRSLAGAVQCRTERRRRDFHDRWIVVRSRVEDCSSRSSHKRRSAPVRNLLQSPKAWRSTPWSYWLDGDSVVSIRAPYVRVVKQPTLRLQSQSAWLASNSKGKGLLTE